MVILAVDFSCSGANVSDSPWQVIGFTFLLCTFEAVAVVEFLVGQDSQR